MSNRILVTRYPGKVATMGRTVYVRIPKEVVDRMDLKNGEELDVTLEIPTYEHLIDKQH